LRLKEKPVSSDPSSQAPFRLQFEIPFLFPKSRTDLSVSSSEARHEVMTSRAEACRPSMAAFGGSVWPLELAAFLEKESGKSTAPPSRVSSPRVPQSGDAEVPRCNRKREEEGYGGRGDPGHGLEDFDRWILFDTFGCSADLALEEEAGAQTINVGTNWEWYLSGPLSRTT